MIDLMLGDRARPEDFNRRPDNPDEGRGRVIGNRVVVPHNMDGVVLGPVQRHQIMLVNRRKLRTATVKACRGKRRANCVDDLEGRGMVWHPKADCPVHRHQPIAKEVGLSDNHAERTGGEPAEQADGTLR